MAGCLEVVNKAPLLMVFFIHFYLFLPTFLLRIEYIKDIFLSKKSRRSMMSRYYLLCVVTIKFCTMQLHVMAFTVVSLRLRDSSNHHPSPNTLPALSFEHEAVHSNRNPITLPSSPPPKTNKNLTHIAFICDGNSRWAYQSFRKDLTQRDNQTHTRDSQGLSIGNSSLQMLGHARGAARVVSLTQDICKRYPHIRFMTIYAFSTENWSRPAKEIDALWKVMEQYCDEFYSWAIGNIVIKIIGDIEDARIPISLRNRLKELELKTKWEVKDSVSMIQNKHQGITDTTSMNYGEYNQDGLQQQQQQQQQPPLTLNIAINYGGRKDIIHATRLIAEAYQRGNLKMDDINEETFDEYLFTSGIPALDLIIRTGGDQRLSNFLLWQSAYAELYFSDVLWPDFDETCLDKAMQWYATRDRRFGGHS